MYKYLFCYVAFSLIFIKCDHTNTKHEKTDLIIVDGFPKEEKLIATDIEIPPILLNPSSLCIIDTFLVVYQNRKDTVINIFSLPKCKYLTGFGQKGRGPNEFSLDFGNTTLKPVFSDKAGFGIGNLMTQVWYFKISDILNGVKEPYKKINLPAKTNGTRAIVYMSDTVIYGAPYGGDMHLFRFSLPDNKFKKFKSYPNDFPLLNNYAKRTVYGCYMAIKPDNSQFVVSYSRIGKLEIYSENDNRPTILRYKNFPSLAMHTGLNKASKGIPGSREEKVFCWSIKASQKYIYAKIYNKRYQDLLKNGHISTSYIPEIHVFTWKGKPVTIIRLDAYYKYYAIDEKDKYLYTINDKMENLIKRYDLSVINGF